MDNAAVRALRADGRVHDARRRMVRRGADSKIVARRHTHGVVASHTFALSLPAASVGCAFSGYFTARRTVLKYAAVQIFEQAVKIAVSVLMLRFWAAKGAEYACDAVALGITISQISSLICAFLLYKSTKHQKAERKNARRASCSAAHCAPGRRRIVRALGAADNRTPADSRGLFANRGRARAAR